MKRIIISLLLAFGMIVGIAIPANAGWRGVDSSNGEVYNARQVTTGISSRRATWRIYGFTPGDRDRDTAHQDNTVVRVCNWAGPRRADVLARAVRQNGRWGWTSAASYDDYDNCVYLFVNPDARWVRVKIDGIRNGKGWQTFDIWLPPRRETR